MAFPSIRSQATTNGTTATATPALNLPATILAGDTLIGFFRSAAGGSIGWPGAWTVLVNAAPDVSTDQVGIAWTRALGTETGTISLTAANQKFAGIISSIGGSRDPREQPPQLSTVAIGTTPAQPDATTCTPTGGARDYLWIAWYSMSGEQTAVTTYPTNYTLNQSGLVNSGTAGITTTNVTMATAGRQLNAASEDVSVWSIAGTLEGWSAYTVAIHPLVPYPYLAFYPPKVSHEQGRRHLSSGMTPPCHKAPGTLV